MGSGIYQSQRAVWYGVMELVWGGTISKGEWYCDRRCSLVKKEKRLQLC